MQYITFLFLTKRLRGIRVVTQIQPKHGIPLTEKISQEFNST